LEWVGKAHLLFWDLLWAVLTGFDSCQIQIFLLCHHIQSTVRLMQSPI